jgi:hypothetical protein
VAVPVGWTVLLGLAVTVDVTWAVLVVVAVWLGSVVAVPVTVVVGVVVSVAVTVSVPVTVSVADAVPVTSGVTVVVTVPVTVAEATSVSVCAGCFLLLDRSSCAGPRAACATGVLLALPFAATANATLASIRAGTLNMIRSLCNPPLSHCVGNLFTM